MTDPLVVEFRVAAPQKYAFTLWTERVALWWPPGHTISGTAERIVFDGRPGGRIYEQTADGVEHDWGTVVAWEPPGRVVYRWHMFFDPSEATEIEVTFTSDGSTYTLVRLEQRGWENLGDAGPPRRVRTGQVWTMMTEHYLAVAGLD